MYPVPKEKVVVVTVIGPKLRTMIDCAADPLFTGVHVNSVAEAAHTARSYGARAVLLSPAVLEQHSVTDISALVRRTPGVLSIAVLSADYPKTDEALLTLGACGVRRLVDLSQRDGWTCLRLLVDQLGGETGTAILSGLLRHLPEETDSLHSFFGELVRMAPSTMTVQALAGSLRVAPSTLISRFFRAGLPSPKLYLVMTRLTYAAAFLEEQRVSVSDVSEHLGYSSAQSFCRHVRSVLGLTSGEYRRSYPLARALEHFADRLILPYREALQTFVPLGPGFIGCGRRPRPIRLGAKLD